MTNKDLDTVAACLGAAYKWAQVSGTEQAADGVWSVKQRLELELRLAGKGRQAEKLTELMQVWYERHTGY